MNDYIIWEFRDLPQQFATPVGKLDQAVSKMRTQLGLDPDHAYRVLNIPNVPTESEKEVIHHDYTGFDTTKHGTRSVYRNGKKSKVIPPDPPAPQAEPEATELLPVPDVLDQSSNSDPVL